MVEEDSAESEDDEGRQAGAGVQQRHTHRLAFIGRDVCDVGHCRHQDAVQTSTASVTHGCQEHESEGGFDVDAVEDHDDAAERLSDERRQDGKLATDSIAELTKHEDRDERERNGNACRIEKPLRVQL